jgi:thioredoxin 1
MDRMVIELNRDSYEAEVLESREPVLVDFWGPQCQPCLALMPVVERIEREYAGKLKLAKVNASMNRMLCAKLRVLGLPTFILYNGGVEVRRLAGEQITENELLDAIKRVLTS